MTWFAYDADGALVKKVAGGETTVYVGKIYEKNLATGKVTRYYFFGSQRVAMRKGGMLYYLAGDRVRSGEHRAPRAW
jgi:hypothetical protein